MASSSLTWRLCRGGKVSTQTHFSFTSLSTITGRWSRLRIQFISYFMGTWFFWCCSDLHSTPVCVTHEDLTVSVLLWDLYLNLKWTSVCFSTVWINRMSFFPTMLVKKTPDIHIVSPLPSSVRHPVLHLSLRQRWYGCDGNRLPQGAVPVHPPGVSTSAGPWERNPHQDAGPTAAQAGRKCLPILLWGESQKQLIRDGLGEGAQLSFQQSVSRNTAE